MSHLTAPPKLVQLGQISGVFGVRGWVKVRSYTRPREGIFAYNPWLLHAPEGWRAYSLVQGKLQGRSVIAQLQGVADRDQASALLGQAIAVAESELPVLPQGQYYWDQLEGLEVRTLEGVVLGKVEYLIETGANDVLVVRGEREHLLPYIPNVVRQVQLDTGVLLVDWDPDF